MRVRGSRWGDTQNQTPSGVFRHGGVEYLCLHLALPDSQCLLAWRGGGKDGEKEKLLREESL